MKNESALCALYASRSDRRQSMMAKVSSFRFNRRLNRLVPSLYRIYDLLPVGGLDHPSVHPTTMTQVPMSGPVDVSIIANPLTRATPLTDAPRSTELLLQ
jgi:hypothetical protein